MANSNLFKKVRRDSDSQDVRDLSKPFLKEIGIETTEHFEFIDITKQVASAVKESGKTDGYVLVYSRHTTSGIHISENEPNLLKDMQEFFEEKVPKTGVYWHNFNNVDGRENAHSHIMAMMVQNSTIIPLKDSKMMLGEWQSVFFIEFDGPRKNRHFVVQVG